MGFKYGLGGTLAVLIITLIADRMGSAAGKLPEDEAKTLKVLQASLAKVSEWKTFSAEVKYEDKRSFIKDFLMPVKNVITEENKVVFQKSDDGKYKSYTNIKREDDYQVPLFGYKSDLFWQYEWVQTESGSFWLKLDKVPDSSPLPEEYRKLLSTWNQGDDGLRAGYANPFTDHIDVGLGEAKFLEEKYVESIEDLPDQEVNGEASSCYRIHPVTVKTDTVGDGVFTQKLARTEQLEFSDAQALEGFPAVNLQSDKELLAAATELETTENVAAEESYSVCISKNDDKSLVQIGKVSSIGPVSLQAGGHFFINLVMNESSTRTYSGFDEPVEFPEYDTSAPSAESPPTPEWFRGEENDLQ